MSFALKTSDRFAGDAVPLAESLADLNDAIHQWVEELQVGHAWESRMDLAQDVATFSATLQKLASGEVSRSASHMKHDLDRSMRALNVLVQSDYAWLAPVKEQLKEFNEQHGQELDALRVVAADEVRILELVRQNKQPYIVKLPFKDAQEKALGMVEGLEATAQVLRQFGEAQFAEAAQAPNFKATAHIDEASLKNRLDTAEAADRSAQTLRAIAGAQPFESATAALQALEDLNRDATALASFHYRNEGGFNELQDHLEKYGMLYNESLRAAKTASDKEKGRVP